MRIKYALSLLLLPAVFVAGCKGGCDASGDAANQESLNQTKENKMDFSKVLFWNVDTQKDFMNADGALSVAQAEAIKPTLADITAFAKQNGIRVVNTADWHYADSKELSDKPDGVNTFPAHCMADTDGAQFIAETMPEKPLLVSWEQYKPDFETSARNYIILKDAFDVFAGNPNTDNLVEALYDDHGIEVICVYGVASNVCVKAAVEGLKERNFKVVVFEDAVKGLPGIPDPLDAWRAEDSGVQVVRFNDFSQGKTTVNF